MLYKFTVLFIVALLLVVFNNFVILLNNIGTRKSTYAQYLNMASLWISGIFYTITVILAFVSTTFIGSIDSPLPKTEAYPITALKAIDSSLSFFGYDERTTIMAFYVDENDDMRSCNQYISDTLLTKELLMEHVENSTTDTIQVDTVKSDYYLFGTKVYTENKRGDCNIALTEDTITQFVTANNNTENKIYNNE